MNKFTTLSVILLLTSMLSGCSTPTMKADEGIEEITIRMDYGFNADSCQSLGEVTGSEGHWYSYLFFPNDVLIQGALHDAKNQALALGADTIYLVNPQDFATSFTVFGMAYDCNQPNSLTSDTYSGQML
ncbi:DUF4156 domain-containing protein [Vibrio sp. ZSDE26]|uniref:DUF4156 domain-containing protein n=1 Tax=Vibrio amylolyticus TaxID=2847292 RepID=A0A9X2BIV7_9VIBR|nr:DUF4156 domain-containing protein [Vibrio amylolyticus]MCK6265446.1 DUF4156 domain-containing protein [Vibrio amylolyticus]